MKIKFSILRFPLIIVFVIILFLPAINKTFGFWEFERRDENRNFHDTIDFDWHHPEKIPAEYDAYLSDNFSFRSPLLNLYHKIKYKLFHVSPHPKISIVGKNDWYFKVKEQRLFEGKQNFSDEELGFLLKEWNRRKTYLDSVNTPFYWMICPIKHNIYHEKMPINIRQADTSRLTQVIEYFDKYMPGLIVDPTPALMEAKENHKVYYQLDNHWNYYGGYIASNVLLDRIHNDFLQYDIPLIKEYEWQDSIIYKGIHHNVFGIDDLGELERYPVWESRNAKKVDPYGFTPPESFPYPKSYELRYLNKKDSTGLKVLMIRDSFAIFMMHFLNECFHETEYIFDNWEYKLNEDIIESINPDLVIFLTLESHIDALIPDYK